MAAGALPKVPLLSPAGLALWLTFTVFMDPGCTQKMANDSKQKPFSESTFFEDHRSARPLVPGTIPRGYLREDQAFYAGKIATNFIANVPISLTWDDLQRGRQRFEIFCAPCHGGLGNGDGMVVSRGFRRPASFHLPRLRDAPDGYYFDVISNGFGVMSDYAAQLTPLDRWKIVGYVRALQLSQNAALKDLPPEERIRLETSKP